MKKHIHCFVSDHAVIDGANNVNINDMKNIANGSCDYVTFNELNTMPYDDIESIILGLSKKIKLHSGRLLIEYLNFDKLINDITYKKLSIEQINKTLTNRNSFFYEELVDKILNQHKLMLEQIVYNDFITQISIIRHE